MLVALLELLLEAFLLELQLFLLLLLEVAF